MKTTNDDRSRIDYLFNYRQDIQNKIDSLRDEIAGLEMMKHEVEEKIFDIQDIALIKIGSQWR